jgi:hypothetical protein
MKRFILAAAIVLQLAALAPTTTAELPYPLCDLEQTDCPW